MKSKKNSENFLSEQTTSTEDKTKLSERLGKIVGSVKLPLDFDDEAELRQYFEEKHLR